MNQKQGVGGGLVLLVIVLASLVKRTERLVVEGGSMVPALSPGDHVLSVRGLPLRPGHIVAAADPRDGRLLVKRVVAVAPDGVITVAGDDPAHSTDSRNFGPLAPALVRGRVVYRYSPIAQSGRLSTVPPATGW